MLEFCKITIITRDSTKVPFFIGSKIRGAFGKELKNIVCIDEVKDCKACKFTQDCLYYQFYEHKNTYHHFRFDFELGKNYYDFSIVLFNESIENAIIIMAVLHRILIDEFHCKETSFFVNNRLCDINDIATLPLKQPFIAREFAPCVRLTLNTPLRIKKHNSFVRDDRLELKDIFYSIFQRKLAIAGENRTKMPDFSGKITYKNLRYMELYRKSRNHNEMRLGGLVGEIYIEDLDRESFALLNLGELIGVGKQCSFGLGKISIAY